MIIQNNWQMIQESLFRTILSLIEVNLGKNYYQYLPLFYTIFLFIFLSNFLGVLPYTKTPSVELVITLSIATILLVGNLIIGIQNHSIYVLSVFLPAGCPVVLVPLMIVLECLAYVFRTISLGLRLAINIMTGKILCSVIIGFVQTMFESGFSLYILLLPLSFLTVYISLEILICYLQAYIFLFISCLTFKDLA
jgi:F-type H+-transporting ATPase subunit a